MASETSLEDVLEIFNNTVKACLHQMDPGVFGLSSRFIFFISQNDRTTVIKSSTKIFELEHFQKSAFVTVAKEQENKILCYTYDIFHHEDYAQTLVQTKKQNKENIVKRVSLTSIMQKGSTSEMLTPFTQRTNFRGKPFIVSPMVWSDRVTWSSITNDYYGFEMDLLNTCRDVLNFSYTIVLPKVPVVFMLSEDKKTYVGAVADVANGIADISLGDSMLSSTVNRLVDSSASFDSDVFDLVSPMPKTINPFLVALLPFQMSVWGWLLLTFAASVVAFVLISKFEERIIEDQKENYFKEWNTFTSSFLFCFRTLLLEGVDASINVTQKANAIRYPNT